MIIGIVAIAENFAIGRDGKLPWHYRADLKFFKETTNGHAVVMGAKTWASIGRALPGRRNIVLSRRRDLELPEGVEPVASREEVLEIARTAGTDVFILGGAEVFSLFADDIEKWIVTEVPMTVDDADTFMPRDFLDRFELDSTLELGEGLIVSTYRHSSQN